MIIYLAKKIIFAFAMLKNIIIFALTYICVGILLAVVWNFGMRSYSVDSDEAMKR
jgi:hypothetical protein